MCYHYNFLAFGDLRAGAVSAKLPFLPHVSHFDGDEEGIEGSTFAAAVLKAAKGLGVPELPSCLHICHKWQMRGQGC